MKRRVFCIFTMLSLLFCLIQPAYAIQASFYESHTDWHFDLSIEPDRAMTVEEFVALTTAYSYWSVGTDGDTPKDKNGDLPSEWAAPYIRAEAAKGALTPSEIDYDAPATLAFAMKFFVNSKGLYGFNAINLRSFSGTEGLSTEEKLCLNTAVDYGIFPYRENMDVSALLLRGDLEEKYLIPEGTLQPTAQKLSAAQFYPSSMIFFEDCYNDRAASQRQLELFQANADSFTIVSLDAVYFMRSKANESDGTYVGDFICHASMGQDDPQLALLDFCKEQGITVLGGVLNWFDDSSMQAISVSDEAMEQAVEELVQEVERYDLDGLNVDIELHGNTYRETYSALVRRLSQRLHEMDKTLMLTVNGRIWEKDGASTIYDYSVVDEAADLITIITYDLYSARSYGNGAGCGEMSNFTFTDRCARYAAVEFGAERVLLGVSGYAICYNQTAHTAKNISVTEAEALMQTYGATPACHDSKVDDWYFSYQDENGESYIVYLESSAGLNRRVKLAQQYGLAGVAGFHIGGESQTMFDAMGKYCSTLPFTDVHAGDWFLQSIEYVYEHGLFNGVTATTFEPESSMTRAMLVTVLWRLEGCPEPQNAANFQDVSPRDWYHKQVAWASENGIVNGVGKNCFEPEENVTREQLATILYRYVSMKAISTQARADLTVYPDSGSVDAWAEEALRWAIGAGLINGTVKDGSRETVLDPLGNATRAQVATILMRFVRNVIGESA